MSNCLEKLLSHLPGKVFDREPGERLALRVRNPDGLRWRVSGGVLRLTSAEKIVNFDGSTEWDGSNCFGAYSWDYPLAELTISQLSDAIQRDGHAVVYENSDVGSLSALALIPGENDQENSNGDHLYVFTSPLWSILGAYAVEVEGLGNAVTEALRQMVAQQSEGEILDVWTELYGVRPAAGETDAEQLARFYREVLRPRNTARAIERAVLEQTGEVVRVDEPWRRMFVLGESALSGEHRFQDGEFYTYHVIQVICDESADVSRIVPVVERNLAAGIDLVVPRAEFLARYAELMPDGIQIESAGHELRSQSAKISSTQVLGVMRLSGDEGEMLNYLVAQSWVTQIEQAPEIAYDRELWGGADHPPANHPDAEHRGLRLRSPFGAPRVRSMASVCLSDGVPMGDENFVLSRGLEVIDQREAMLLSESARLSDADIEVRREVVDQVVIAVHARLVDLQLAGAFIAGGALHGHGATYDPPISAAWAMRSDAE